MLPKHKNFKSSENQQPKVTYSNNNELQEDDYEAKDFIFRIASSQDGKQHRQCWLN